MHPPRPCSFSRTTHNQLRSFTKRAKYNRKQNSTMTGDLEVVKGAAVPDPASAVNKRFYNFWRGHPNNGLLPVDEMRGLLQEIKSSTAESIARSLQYPRALDLGCARGSDRAVAWPQTQPGEPHHRWGCHVPLSLRGVDSGDDDSLEW